jgi:hypothetical protein
MGSLVQICAYFDAHRFLKLMADEGARAFLVWQDRVKPKSKDCLTTAKSLDMMTCKHLGELPILQCNMLLGFFSVNVHPSSFMFIREEKLCLAFIAGVNL